MKNCEKATFAAGCFWSVEETFLNMKGILATQVGYTGGTLKDPTYEMVCTGKTGHAEAVQVEFDPALVTYKELVEVFWNLHDPTTLNCQGPDHGTQYRSAIYYHSAQQKEAALTSKQTLERTGIFQNPVVTEITPAGPFYKAEDYHQKYISKRNSASA